MTAPRPDGSEAARAMRLALEEAELPPSRLSYVNAHATGTRLGDAAEVRALRSVLGESTTGVPVSGTKGLYGHALGASGAIEAAIVALSIRRRYLPGTVNFEAADDDCGLNVLPPPGRHGEIDVAMSTSFGFGGANAALLFARDGAMP
jgi:3-oxoacyl-[acyl-carrier-protein] synthase II